MSEGQDLLLEEEATLGWDVRAAREAKLPVLQPEKSRCAYGKPVTSLCLHCPFVKQGNYNLPALYGCWEATLMFVNHFEDGSDCSLLWQVEDLWPLPFLPVAWQLS